MKISASITDFPLFSQIETFFKEFKKAGVDGVELVIGVKSRFFIDRMLSFVKEYDLPVTSVHQPPWSGVGLYFDEEFVTFAQRLGTNNIVFHPLTFQSFDGSRMKRYFKRLAQLQQMYGVHIMLENMPNDITYRKLHQFPGNTMSQHIQRLSEVADEYGFLLTYDVSHAEWKAPQKEKIFEDMFSKIGNIHVSSFSSHKHHLPLTMGNLDSEGFIKYLIEKKYKGLLTFEVYYPKLRMMINKYNFSAIADSVTKFRKITDKLS